MGILINPNDVIDIMENKLKGMAKFEPVIKPGEVRAVMPFVPKWAFYIVVSVMSLIGILIPPFIAKEVAMLKSSVKQEENIKTMKEAILRIEKNQEKITARQNLESDYADVVIEEYDERLDDLEYEVKLLRE